jgi:hypothetical protein
VSPRSTFSPERTVTSPRYETETFMPFCSMVTVHIPATEPAKATEPDSGASTLVPGGAATSTPQCPPYMPSGA